MQLAKPFLYSVIRSSKYLYLTKLVIISNKITFLYNIFIRFYTQRSITMLQKAPTFARIYNEICHLIRFKVNLLLNRMGQALNVFFLSLLFVLCDSFSFLIVTVTDLPECAHKIRRRLHLSAQSDIRPFIPAFFHNLAF